MRNAAVLDSGGISVRSLLDELEKIAVTMRSLRGAVRRIKPDPLPPGQAGSLIDAFGAVVTPTKRQARRFTELGEPAYMKLIPPEVVRPIQEYAVKAPGRIHVAPGAGRVLDAGASGRKAKDIKALATVHESLERKVKPREIQYSSLHASPKVMVEESNLLNRMQGTGRAAAESLRGLREAGGELPLLRRQFGQTFKDPRALQFLEPGQRVPAAMKRRFVRQGREPLSVEEAGGMFRGAQDELIRRMQPKVGGPFG